VNSPRVPEPALIGTRLSVFHRTTFNYGSPASNSVNTLHLEPRTFPYQKTLGALIRVMPATRVRRFTDSVPSVYHKAAALMRWIHQEFRYEPGATNVNTHLEEAFQMRHGVCQDFTHVMLGLCRAVGIPARYASGYLYNGPRDTLVGAQASHAWAEVYLPKAGWIGFDPTNNTLADERYVKISVGRDYDDVAPVRGNYQGTGHCRMEVEVAVEKI
jgi:transglutaminase-like putative cysteine protease